MSTSGTAMNAMGEGTGYEQPSLTPIGNLKDLLAATQGSSCDGLFTTPGNGLEPDMCEG